MTNNAFNPFMMPNFGQGGADSANNPLLASMEMMRHAMAGMSAQTPGDASAGGIGGMGGGLNFAQALNPEDIERRISELKVVENWLKLNLSMLTSTIQGLEVQLATIQTLKSFAAMGAQANEASQTMQKAWSAQASQGSATASGEVPTQPPVSGQSPLEAALGMMPSAQSAANAKAQAEQAEQAAQAHQELSAAANQQAAQAAATAAQVAALAASQPITQTDGQTKTPGSSIPPAGQAWWNMLEKQFSQIATATQEATQVANEAAAKLVKSSQAVPQKPSVTPTKKAAVKKSTAARQPVKSKGTAQSKATAKPAAKVASKPASKLTSKAAPSPSKPSGTKS